MQYYTYTIGSSLNSHLSVIELCRPQGVATVDRGPSWETASDTHTHPFAAPTCEVKGGWGSLQIT